MKTSFTNRSRLLRTLVILFCCGLVLLTNRWLTFDEGISVLVADDTRSYMALAQAAPLLPSEQTQPKLPSNHAMRLVPAWLVGVAAYATGTDEFRMFVVMTLIVCSGIVWTLHRILCTLELSDAQYTLCMGMFVLNPYTFRYYLAVPAMVGDMVFVCGLGMVILGLLRVQITTLVLGSVLAVLGRQNAIIALPAVVLWIWSDNKWQQQPLSKRIIASVLVIIAVLMPYITLSRLTAPFSERGLEHEALTGMMTWALAPAAAAQKLRLLMEYLWRLNIALLAPLCIIVGVVAGRFAQSKQQLQNLSNSTSAHTASVKDTFAVLYNLDRRIWLLMLIASVLYGFAFLGGPELFMSGVTRYVSHTLIAVIAAVGLLLQQSNVLSAYPNKKVEHANKILWRTLFLILGLAFIGSLHHLTTWVWGNQTSAVAGYFALLNTFTSLCMGAVMWQYTRQSVTST
jgi:hypothetical protein